MAALYARTVFFTTDAQRSLEFYTKKLGFTLDWNSNDGVFQVSLMGFELIVNEIYSHETARPGSGRLFIGLDPEQEEPLRRHIADFGIETSRRTWGRPTLEIKDVDGNQLFIWPAGEDLGVLDGRSSSAPNLVEE